MAFLLLPLGFGAACQSVEPAPEAPPSLFLELRALTGEPVPGARVLLPSGEELQSDARGQLLWPSLPEGHQVLRVETPGFASSLLALDLEPGVRAGTRLELLPLGAPVATFDTHDGASFAKADIFVTVPPGELLDAEGRVLQGEVEAYLAPLDLDDLQKAELLAAPGELRGVLHPGEPPVNLESVALMVLTFRQKAGAGPAFASRRASEVFPLARRLGIRGRVPGSVLAQAVPSSGEATRAAGVSSPVPLWRLDSSTGLWLPTGDVATLGESPAGSGQFTYALTLEHPAPLLHVARPFSDHPGAPAGPQALAASAPAWRQTACLAVRVEDEEGHAVAGRAVVALGVDYVSASRAVTDGDGRALLEVMRDRTVRLDAGATRVELHTSREAGTCTGEGVAPTDVTLRVPVPACQPGATRACAYTGPERTLGLGICRAGQRACGVEGEGWSTTCQGEVLPQEETCATALDDDCDGLTNEGCPLLCTPGEKRPCYEGPEGTRDVGVCRAGARTCEPGGTTWSACGGQVLPRAEDCGHPEDENCDGVACQCWPGQRRACAYNGPAGTLGVGACQEGAQTCEDAGTGWSACTGEVLPQTESCANTMDDDCNGLLNDALTCVCLPGTREACYGGPAGTRDVGTCHGGVRTCEASGTAWSACTGELTPRAEDCATSADENCDGEVNEARVCICVPNTRRNCYTGPSGTEGVGPCHAGTQTCDGAGAGWSACTGEVLPQAESCANTIDDDCNGQPNDAPTCLCPPGTREACPYSGPPGTAGVGECRAGSRTCDVSGTAWSACAGEVVPQLERCTNNKDDDCNGQTDEPTCQWSSVPNMASPRALHTATRLDSGKVLVSGGQSNSSTYLQTFELYDPVAHTWAPPGNMMTARAGHTATLLSNGKVLVSGGRSHGGTYLATAEVYDSVSDTWSSANSMRIARAGHTATRLTNGTVLVVGGQSNGSTHLLTADLYDPDSNSWSPASSMKFTRAWHTATLLNNGTVLVSGGESDGDIYPVEAEVYDPAANAWTTVGNLKTARAKHAAVLLNSGKVLVAGGVSDGYYRTASEVYDPSGRTWSSVLHMNRVRIQHTATLLGNGRALVTGGRSIELRDDGEIYDPGSNTWSSTGPMTSFRYLHTATLLGDGRVLVVGGWADTNGTAVNTAQLYHP